MRVRRVSIVACAASIFAAVVLNSTPAVSAQTADVQALRQEIEQLRKEFEAVQQQYGERLSALEARLGAGNVPTPVRDRGAGANRIAADLRRPFCDLEDLQPRHRRGRELRWRCRLK